MKRLESLPFIFPLHFSLTFTVFLMFLKQHTCLKHHLSLNLSGVSYSGHRTPDSLHVKLHLKHTQQNCSLETHNLLRIKKSQVFVFQPQATDELLYKQTSPR